MSLHNTTTLRLSLWALVSLLLLNSCKKDETEDPEPEEEKNFLASEVDKLGEVSFDGFTIPTFYDIEGDLAPGAYNGQKRRLAQLQEIVDSSRNEPIYWDLGAALENDGRDKFASPAAQGDSDLRTKIDELNFDNGNTAVADAFESLADSLVNSSQENYTVIASNGTAGMINTSGKKRHVSPNGLEYAQILEKGMYGPLLYNQMVADYLRPSQAGADNPLGNNESAVSDYADNGTSRQHKFDEAFGYLGADPDTYPNASNTSSGDGSFMANYMFDFSDETEAAYGINLAEKTMEAFILGRSALKAGEGFGPGDETTNEKVYNAARADVILYTEAALAAAANHYLNDAISDITDDDKLHHLSEALGFIYALAFNPEGRVTEQEAFAVLQILGWSGSSLTLEGIYDINLWEVTDEQMESAKSKLNESFPGYNNVSF